MSDVIRDREHFGDIAEFQDPEQLYTELAEKVKKYHPSDDISMIEKAYHLARDAHEGQMRKSGEPYIIHPLCVGIILADLEMDKETIAAGLLHDVVEDTIMTTEDLEKDFGQDVAELVDGVTKLSKLQYHGDKVEFQADNLRKMFLAMAKDIRVIIIKLADRLHNMRTLQYQPENKQLEIAKETIDIYSPIAQRLGISKIKVELDDCALKYLQPEVYDDLKEKIAQKRSEREEFVEGIVTEVRKHMEDVGIKCRVDGRVKHFFSIYKKMVNQEKTLDQIYDLFAVRIYVDTVRDCYAALGIIHEMYKPIPGRFKDYIATPKDNMYQSLHTTLIGHSGIPFEIQIRTYEMHKTAEYGIAAHWRYKEAADGVNPDLQEEEKLAWLRQILEWQQDMSDNQEFLKSLKADLNLFSDQVYCFTPTGDVKTLPAGATPIDFAYAIHSAVGNRMIGAKVNGKLAHIDHHLQNGDRVEIITSQNSKGPSMDWLNIVKSTQAKSKINQWFKHELKEENVVRGKEAFASYCKAHGIKQSKITKPEYMEEVMQKYGFKDWDAVYAAIGHGGLKEGQVVMRMNELYERDHTKVTDKDILDDLDEKTKHAIKRKRNGGIVVKGVHDVSVRFSKCCSPLPGDEIVGFVTRGRGISIHRTDCVNIVKMSESDKDRMIEAEWDKNLGKSAENESYNAEINIYANNRSGLLVDITKTFADSNMDILGINTRISKQGVATITVSFEIHNTEDLERIRTKLINIESVMDVERSIG
ncbi:MAG: bifunctional (p)ppGpp synthetase/guanosine-3',5'-bis(diphosphate) 3'-pyrophosphohydrolase [Lachnospiraceae bacterium]|nr:bifunctional (p)ppGpp synthetase/guanosine-3',5'-bis(diphosphate) 3'-pyrophosphohydrolase [Lachnospiraceae bacterium]